VRIDLSAADVSREILVSEVGDLQECS